MQIRRSGFVLSLILLLSLLAGCKLNNTIQEDSWDLLSAVQTTEGLEVKIAGQNLLQNRKVKIEADSTEDKKYSVKYLTDGVKDNEEFRWSSENDWENPEHWIQVTFPEETSVSGVRLYWERLNACDYALEVSKDGKQWTEVMVKNQAPEEKIETLVFSETLTTSYLRLHVKEVNRLEEDASLYYQNISLLEMEVFGIPRDEFVISSFCIGEGENRKLELPKVPDGYELKFLGAEHGDLIREDGTVADTIARAETEVGFSLALEGKIIELPGMKVVVPSSGKTEWEMSSHEDEKQEAGNKVKDDSYHDKRELEQNCGILSMEWVSFKKELQVNDRTKVEYRILEEEANILGEEGFQITIDADKNVILMEGKTQTALRWGQVTYEQMLERGSGILPAGIMRDYPAYEVRGFGIDVGRKAVSLEFLYDIVEAMSKEKMNTLLVHLNDNQIIAQSGYDGTLEGARELYAAFRLESDIRNEEGVGITSEDFYYTKEEFAQFIKDAKKLGVEVVPEIDTPGHSLAFVKVFPQLGIENPETADLLDVSKEETLELVKSIWKEYLTDTKNQEAVFGECDTLHIGMDEYFGKSREYISYLTELAEYIKELAPEKEIRMWGSLTGMDCDYSKVSRDIQIQLWSTDWANPMEMYQAGFDIINSQNTRLYLVPGTGYDRLDIGYLAKEWEPNVFETSKKKWEIPSYSPQMLGACYVLWNDMVFIDGIEIREEDIFARFEEPLGIIADKLW